MQRIEADTTKLMAIECVRGQNLFQQPHQFTALKLLERRAIARFFFRDVVGRQRHGDFKIQCGTGFQPVFAIFKI